MSKIFCWLFSCVAIASKKHLKNLFEDEANHIWFVGSNCSPKFCDDWNVLLSLYLLSQWLTFSIFGDSIFI